MALTATCRKCNREVEPGDICPICGTKLAKTATHAAWVVERVPVRDWMCWNSVMRWLLPGGLAVLVLVLALEAASGGTAEVERLFRSGFLTTLLILLLAVLAGVFLLLLLQGKELMDYVIDSRGVHVTRYLPNPTPLKLIARMKSPGLMARVSPEADPPVLRLDERDLSWRNVARVQLWPEKCYILFYAPAWWLQIPVRCTPFSWEDALYYVRDKLGKKKAVNLPEHLRTPAEKKPAVRRSIRSTPVKTPPESVPAAYPEPEESDPFGESSPPEGLPSEEEEDPGKGDAPSPGQISLFD